MLRWCHYTIFIAADHRDDHEDSKMKMGENIEIDLYTAAVTSIIVVCVCLFFAVATVLGHLAQYNQIMGLRRRNGAALASRSGGQDAYENVANGYHELNDKNPKMKENLYMDKLPSAAMVG